MLSGELQKYIYKSKYSIYKRGENRRENWDESVNRVREMMLNKYPQITSDINSAYDMMLDQRILGSQRALQFGGIPVLAHQARCYNCTASFCDRLRFFQECFYLLLCGCGTGFSVQNHHINGLPELSPARRRGRILPQKIFQIPDTIEGWSDALGVLMSSYCESPIFPEYHECDVVFDASKIRPKGSPLSSGVGKAPGPQPLLNGLESVNILLDQISRQEGLHRFRPIHCYDIMMHISDKAVLAGGVRRSATAILFDLFDEEMIHAKIGNWYWENPQRGRSNNSVVLLRDRVDWVEFEKLSDSIKQYGEPGFYWTDSTEQVPNPCQPSWAKVLTPNGIRTIGEIQTGSKIWSETGWTTVVKKWSTGQNKVYKYETTAGVFYGTDQHKVVSNKTKIEVKDADSIDIFSGPFDTYNHINYQDVIDGIVLGDGTVYETANRQVKLVIGQDDHDYFNSEISEFIGEHTNAGIYLHNVNTKITPEELPLTHNRRVPERFMKGDANKICGFLRGLYTANGSICGQRITLKSTSSGLIEDVQLMLSSIGIRSYFTTNPEKIVEFSNGPYICKESYDLNITVDRKRFAKIVGFIQKDKNLRMSNMIDSISKTYSGKTTYDIISVSYISDEETFDITVDNPTHTYWTQGCNVSNCYEISMFPVDITTGKSGWQMCNLSTINIGRSRDESEFLENCYGAAVIGTCQAGFNSFPYLGQTTENIVKREALLGVSMTGMMRRSEIALNPEIQRRGAEHIIKVNTELAHKIGINPAARNTSIKPEGTGTLILSDWDGKPLDEPGIHAAHAERYIRLVQGNKSEVVLNHFKKYNPFACFHKDDNNDALAFCLEPPKGTKTKKDFSSIEFLENVRLTYKNWIESGKVIERCTQPWLSHNVSNTCEVYDEDWPELMQYVFENQKDFAGISFISRTGDKDYYQAPNCEVFTPQQILEKYGNASLFCSGLIEDADDKFNHLWHACDAVLGKVNNLDENQLEWVARAENFSHKYFEDDTKKMTYCLKDVHNWKLWLDLKRSYKPVDYSTLVELEDTTNVVNEVSCAGGACLI